MRAAAILLLLGLLGCSEPEAQRVGGPCKYASCKGVAIITSVFREGGTVRVTWRFEPRGDCTPSRGSLEGTGQFPDGGEGRRAIVGGNTVREGDRVPCIREEITEGTCTPVRYLFP